MRIAIPISSGQLAQHFGHCEQFAFFDVDTGRVVAEKQEPAPEHEPGLLPRWLSERGVKLVIAGGMGSRALSLFKQEGIEVLIGAESREPATIVRDYLGNRLVTGANGCDH